LPNLLDALNQYFELVAAAMTPHGGEILRFIGDAMLIVFPDDAGADGRDACRPALDAADDAFNSLDVVNHRRKGQFQPTLSFGVGLYYGEVIYGNVGAPDRLDFTVMGAAVNQTSRLEGSTKSLHQRLLMSREFVDLICAPVRSRRGHAMKGFSELREVFGLQ
jgi:adenylate cyclase